MVKTESLHEPMWSAAFQAEVSQVVIATAFTPPSPQPGRFGPFTRARGLPPPEKTSRLQHRDGRPPIATAPAKRSLARSVLLAFRTVAPGTGPTNER